MLEALFGITPALLRPEAELIKLANDSLSLIEVMYAVEDRFRVTLPKMKMQRRSQIRTIDDLVHYADAPVAAKHATVSRQACTS